MEFSFGGVNLFSPNPARAFAFYQALGLPVVEAPTRTALGTAPSWPCRRGGTQPVIWIWRSAPGGGGRYKQPPGVPAGVPDRRKDGGAVSTASGGGF